MSTYIMTRYHIPRLRDSNVNNTIVSLAYLWLEINDFMTQLNAVIEPDISQNTLFHYVSDVMNIGELQEIYIDGAILPDPTIRSDAPTGLGQDGTSVWFSTPDTGIKTVSWFVNGTLVLERQQDLSTNRSATKAELGVSTNDFVQVAIYENDTAGWWGRVQVT